MLSKFSNKSAQKSSIFSQKANFERGLIILCFFPICLWADPWGKDADLAGNKFEKCCLPEQPSLLSEIGISLIRFHQEVISPADGPRSHFIPSSSQYTLEAMRHYGFFKGVMMGCDRLMRENNDPWVYRTIYNSQGKLMKWDPVPLD